jgi:hypothetical protein
LDVFDVYEAWKNHRRNSDMYNFIIEKLMTVDAGDYKITELFLPDFHLIKSLDCECQFNMRWEHFLNNCPGFAKYLLKLDREQLIVSINAPPYAREKLRQAETLADLHGILMRPIQLTRQEIISNLKRSSEYQQLSKQCEQRMYGGYDVGVEKSRLAKFLDNETRKIQSQQTKAAIKSAPLNIRKSTQKNKITITL